MKRLVAAFAVSLTLTGCFTGVESTPRITVPSSDVRAATPEDTFLNSVHPQPPAEWKQGKKFHITDNRFKLLLGATSPDVEIAGRDISLADMRPDRSPTGNAVTRISFTMPGVAQPMVYTFNASPDELRRRSQIDIPFAIDRDMVAQADTLLRGRKVWIITSTWRDTTDAIIAEGRKFVEVLIDSVAPGTVAAPLRVDFTDIATGRNASIFISPDAKVATPRTFGRQFSLSDPRVAYSDIAPEIWHLITAGRVAEGMTRRECRLALGAPADINRRTNYSIMQERWTYDNGVWLLFEDDTLIDFRR